MRSECTCMEIKIKKFTFVGQIIFLGKKIQEKGQFFFLFTCEVMCDDAMR